MKKGCFIIVLVLLTVIVAGVIYFFKYREGDVIEVLKPMIIGSIESEINKKIEEAEKSAYSDSLKAAFNKLINDIKKKSEIDIEKADHIFNNVRFAVGALIINRIISAIDAALIVRSHNKSIAQQTSWNVSFGSNINQPEHLQVNFQLGF